MVIQEMIVQINFEVFKKW